MSGVTFIDKSRPTRHTSHGATNKTQIGMVHFPSSPRSPINHPLDMLDLLGEVVVLVQSESGSESGNTEIDPGTPKTDTETEPDTPLELNTAMGTNLPLEETHPSMMHLVPAAFDPVTFPADRISDWLEHICIMDGNEKQTESHTDTLVDTKDDLDPESIMVLETCTQLLSKIEEVRLAVLHLQYSLRVCSTGDREPKSLQTKHRASRRVWSWDHAGVFLTQEPCL